MNTIDMSWLLELVIAVFLLFGAVVALVGSWGLAKLPDLFMRLHGPTKASTLGVGCTLIGSLLYFSHQQSGVSVQEALVTMFLFATAPVSAHMMAKAALRRHLKCVTRTRNPPGP
ncbi:Na+/H+ antiporter subunit G [Halomonas korlensis]|uniref:Multisubunit potassium/proton antiporter, PhaG subunit (TC 2.A.63.1.1) n=1 Tax=Halomonas korlensis TaxID=463301 RepID=A0A1I7IB11_9GAMM|nr:Na+/H+ antiporter subunit G [Halomonas korlensis]SFU70175.1 multisubunit potassium/proton antiporter, PhaG subunit (TC 2.A.63.1.1) [Halomonas korlensis]